MSTIRDIMWCPNWCLQIFLAMNLVLIYSNLDLGMRICAHEDVSHVFSCLLLYEWKSNGNVGWNTKRDQLQSHFWRGAHKQSLWVTLALHPHCSYYGILMAFTRGWGWRCHLSSINPHAASDPSKTSRSILGSSSSVILSKVTLFWVDM